jgi:hypothetical protein
LKFVVDGIKYTVNMLRIVDKPLTIFLYITRLKFVVDEFYEFLRDTKSPKFL